MSDVFFSGRLTGDKLEVRSTEPIVIEVRRKAVADETNLERAEKIAAAEWAQFWGSKTVKLMVGFLLASTAAYAQGVLQPPPGGAPPVSLKEWLASVVVGLIVLLQRHTAAGIEAKQDVDAS